MLLINTEQSSNDIVMIHPIRSEAKIDSFAEIGKKFKKRSLLKCNRIFFQNKKKTFVENNS